MTYRVRHKKTGRAVLVDDAFKPICDKHGYNHVPKISSMMGVEFDKNGNILRK